MATISTSILVGGGTFPCDDCPLGLLAWLTEEAVFIPAEGREDFVRDLATTERDAEHQVAFIAYLLERGKGNHRSFSAPVPTGFKGAARA